ncbi:hypothetical protein OHV66_06545 [Acinetobacter baumannii]|nr:hypothetical protein [Acinetobacter baumannii]
MMQKIQQAGGRSKAPSPSPLDTAPIARTKKIPFQKKLKQKVKIKLKVEQWH